MTGRPLGVGFFGYDDLSEGDWLQTGSATITGKAVDAFADLSGDRFGIHMTDDAAKAGGFPCRVAHGLLVLSVVDGLKNQAPAQFRAVASLGWDWAFRRPVLVGDTISTRITVIGRRLTRRVDRGILKLGFEVRNASGEVVQDGTNMLMVWR